MPSHTARPLLTLDQYRERVLALRGTGWPRTVRLPLNEAAGRTLTEDGCARIDLPRFANSAMDGFGVAWRDDGQSRRWTVVADLPAGAAADTVLTAGQAVRIMTGAAVPPGVDTIVPLEDAVVEGDTVRFAQPVTPGRHIRAAGEDVQAGEVVLRAGTVLSARHLAAGAAVGLSEVAVAVAPRVAILATGDELADPGEPLGAASVYDSNGPYLAAAVTAAGGVVATRMRSGDSPSTFRAALNLAAKQADLILITGGVSVGDRDVTREVLADQAGAQFVHVAMQPGKPQGCGAWLGVPALALPGNPVSVAVSFACFARPLLEAMLGAKPPERAARGVVAQGWPSPRGRRQFVPVSLTPREDGSLALAPATAGLSGSHLVASLARADALAIVPEEVAEVSLGAVLELLPLF